MRWKKRTFINLRRKQMKKLIYILLGFCVNSFAQNPVLHKMTYYTNDVNNKDSVLYEDESVDTPYSFEFRGKIGTVVLKDANGETIKLDKENLDIYSLISEFVDYDRDLEVRMVVSPDFNANDAGFVISKKPITDLNGEKLDEKCQVEYNFDTLLNSFLYYEFPTSKGFALNLVTEDRSYICCPQYIQNNGNIAVVSLGKPEYCTTYYIRPYLTLNNGDVMFGTEKVFTTLNTMMGALAHQGKAYSRVGNTIITQKAIDSFAREHEDLCGKVLSSDSCLVSFTNSFDKYIKYNNVLSSAFENNIASVDSCTDGTLYFVEELPSSIKADFWKSLNQEVSFDLINDIYWGCDKRQSYYTQNIYASDDNISQFDPSWGVGEGYCLSYVLKKASATSYITYEVPRYLLPGKYKLYVTVVTPPEDAPVSFKVNLFEANDNGELNVDTNPNFTFVPEGDEQYFSPNSEKIIDTICVGEYEFGGASKNLIQIAPKRRHLMKIAEIKLVPVVEE